MHLWLICVNTWGRRGIVVGTGFRALEFLGGDVLRKDGLPDKVAGFPGAVDVGQVVLEYGVEVVIVAVGGTFRVGG